MRYNRGIPPLFPDVTSVGASREGLASLAVWGAILLGLILALVVFTYCYRSRVRRQEEAFGPVFSTQQLRDMRQRGELTDREFERLRAETLAEYSDARRGRNVTARRDSARSE